MAPRNGSAARAHLEEIEGQLSGVRTVTIAFTLPPELADEIERATAAVYKNNRSLLIADALRRYMLHLRNLHNGGKPFRGPRRTPRGRLNRRK